MSDTKAIYQLLFRSKEAMISDRYITQFIGHVELPRGQARHNTFSTLMPCSSGPGNNLREFYEMGDKIPAKMYLNRALPDNWDADAILNNVDFGLDTMGDSARAIMQSSNLPASSPDRESYVILGELAHKNMRIATGSVQQFEGHTDHQDSGLHYKGTFGRELNTHWEIPHPKVLANSKFAKILSTPLWGNNAEAFSLGPHFAPRVSRALIEAVGLVARGCEVHDLPASIRAHIPDNIAGLLSDDDYRDLLNSLHYEDPGLITIPYRPSTKSDLDRYERAVDAYHSYHASMAYA